MVCVDFNFNLVNFLPLRHYFHFLSLFLSRFYLSCRMETFFFSHRTNAVLFFVSFAKIVKAFHSLKINGIVELVSIALLIPDNFFFFLHAVYIYFFGFFFLRSILFPFQFRLMFVFFLRLLYTKLVNFPMARE